MPKTYLEAVDHDAGAFLDKLWARIFTRVAELTGHHHLQHEPGGGDQVMLRLCELSDVFASDAADGQSIVYSASSKHWVPGTGSGGGAGMHQAHLGLLLPTSVVPPGPTNITGSPYTVRAVKIAFDGNILGSFSCGSFYRSLVPGLYAPLTDTWPDGSTMAVNITSYDENASYLAIDVCLEG